ncbi:MAG: response regulator [Roseiflexaceae bacterium]|nr:response regulator [Roseiflexaceae bacterium]
MAIILLVDDEHDILELLELIVEECGHQALSARNGEVAMELARQYAPSLVLTDLMMPVMDGYELVAALQADPALRATPTVVMTAGSITPERRITLEGVQSVITKPFMIADIEALLGGLEKEA